MADEDDIDVEDYAAQVVLYLLSHHVRNSTVRKPDLTKAIMPDNSRKNIKAIIDKAKHTLKTIYGVDLVELDENVKQYMIVNAADTNDVPLNWDDDVKKEQAILLPILSLIFMNGGSATENDVKTFLRRLRITQDLTYGSEEFEDLEKLLKKELVSQRYLVYGITRTNNETEEEPVAEFKWGSRAELEVSKDKVLRFVSEIYGVDITYWPDQLAMLGN